MKASWLKRNHHLPQAGNFWILCESKWEQCTSCPLNPQHTEDQPLSPSLLSSLSLTEEFACFLCSCLQAKCRSGFCWWEAHRDESQQVPTNCNHSEGLSYSQDGQVSETKPMACLNQRHSRRERKNSSLLLIIRYEKKSHPSYGKIVIFVLNSSS